MLRFLNRLGLALIFLVASNAWALGLGDIRLNSALNEPLRAEIELVSATPEELAALTVSLASAETFDRYGLDRPAYIQGLRFEVAQSGSRSVVLISSRAPITEPFLTFIVEASWARGRLLREYTVLLDPPTFAPPAPAQQAVAAPQRVEPRDSGRIERSQPAPQPAAPARTPTRPAPSASQPEVDTRPFSSSTGGDYQVARGQTLWGIASDVRPDSRLSMNQVMLAIFEANPQAFDGNINILKAGAALRIPSADEIYGIDRGAALSEVNRQNEAWDGTPRPTRPAPVEAAPVAQPEPAPEPEPSLTLVPPDEEPVGIGTGSEGTAGEEPMTREQEILERLRQLEAADVPTQQSLINIRNDEMAALRDELARIRGEVPPEPVAATDDPFVDDTAGAELDGEILPEDEAPAEAVIDEPDDARATPAPSNVVRPAPEQPGIVERVLDLLSSFWMIIVGAVVAAGGILFWFLRRRGADDDGSGVWEPLDADDDFDSLSRTSQTESIPAPDGDDAFVVVEQGGQTGGGDTMEIPGAGGDVTVETPSLEDTFSSETAVNLDQSDPIAEADFHMAYGLYDQAADLINGALEVEPTRQDLLTKLSEIYFVWGNRDAFVDAAQRVRDVIGNTDSADWNKIVIMGQQIAADHPLFSGAGVAGATKEVDLSFDAGEDAGGGDLDMVFGDDSDDEDDGGLDFMFDADTSGVDVDETLDVTVETPTVERSADEGTAEMPALDHDIGEALEASGQSSDATAEIDLDDLGLDLDALDDGDDEMSITGTQDALDDTGINEALGDLDAETGKNPAVDPDATGLNPVFDDDEIDMLAATGKTQVLSEDMAVETFTDSNRLIDDNAETLLASDYGDDDAGTGTEVISDDDATLLAPMSDDDDFDFAKTEALPKDAYDNDATAESPALASTDMDLDLDDLTAVLEATDGGDTVEMPKDDATVQQPRPPVDEPTAEVPTMSFDDDDLSDELSEARTMTEVGTKLDLARAYVDMGDPGGARSILEEVLDEGDDEQRQQAKQLLDSLPA